MSNIGKYAIVRSPLDKLVFVPHPLKVLRETPNTIIVHIEDLPGIQEKQVKKKDILSFVDTLDAFEKLNLKNKEIETAMQDVYDLKQVLIDLL